MRSFKASVARTLRRLNLLRSKTLDRPGAGEMDPGLGAERVMAARHALTSLFLKPDMVGVEVGAGTRPFPVPPHVRVTYGDIRDSEALKTYFSGRTTVGGHQTYDAQTMANFKPDSLDFVLSGHVIEHLQDPVGSIKNTINVLAKGGFFILAAPDMRLTFDRDRPETTVDHVLQDYADGGASTRRQSYFEHLTFVHPVLTGEHLPSAEIDRQATAAALRYKELDIHVHAWTMDGFRKMLEATQSIVPFTIVTAFPIENENIFVLQKVGRVA
ncbi:MAG TPA: methyltransferase domain-containing protein [Rhodopila sp.]|nr:methyltransferase domain-containing protein [Rhodopila sp.]